MTTKVLKEYEHLNQQNKSSKANHNQVNKNVLLGSERVRKNFSDILIIFLFIFLISHSVFFVYINDFFINNFVFKLNLTKSFYTFYQMHFLRMLIYILFLRASQNSFANY